MRSLGGAARKWRTFGCLAALVALAGLLTLSATRATTALAMPLSSAPDSISISPSSGPVGTSVTVGIIPSTSITNATQYVLAATTTDPAQGGCSSAQPVLGVDPITVGSQGGGATFNWPSALSAGPYWLCASSQSGPSDTAKSQSPFTVTTGTPATATPIHGGATTPPSAAVLTPSGGAFPGATVSVIVTNWTTPDNSPPATVKLLDNSGVNQPASIPFTAAANSAPGGFTLKVILPSSLALGRYSFELDGAYTLQTTPFTVVAPSATPRIPPVSVPGTTSQGGSSFPLVLVLAIVALVALAAAIIVVMSRRRQ